MRAMKGHLFASLSIGNDYIATLCGSNIGQPHGHVDKPHSEPIYGLPSWQMASIKKIELFPQFQVFIISGTVL